MYQAATEKSPVAGLPLPLFKGIEQQLKRKKQTEEDKIAAIKKDEDQGLFIIRTMGNYFLNQVSNEKAKSLLLAPSYQEGGESKELSLLQRLLYESVHFGPNGIELVAVKILTSTKELAAAIKHPERSLLKELCLREIKAICNGAWRDVVSIDFQNSPATGGQNIEVHLKFLAV